MFRLGDELAVRLPRVAGAAAQVEKEQRWLPRLAPRLPLAVPVPLALGIPNASYPWPWTVCRWIEGETATPERMDDPGRAAVALAEFVVALRAADPADGPPPGEHNFFRGVPLAERDPYVREAIAEVADEYDAGALTAAWEESLCAPAHAGPPAWIHGDLHTTNLLALGGRLCGVLDFGGLGVGDPACDVMAAWTFVPARERDTFRSALGVDEAAWLRGRGWALSMALIALPYHRDRNPAFAAAARGWIAAVLAGASG
jgi:aminoglycoside phosphotransferase (APT) family kinase protein